MLVLVAVKAVGGGRLLAVRRGGGVVLRHGVAGAALGPVSVARWNVLNVGRVVCYIETVVRLTQVMLVGLAIDGQLMLVGHIGRVAVVGARLELAGRGVQTIGAAMGLGRSGDVRLNGLTVLRATGQSWNDRGLIEVGGADLAWRIVRAGVASIAVEIGVRRAACRFVGGPESLLVLVILTLWLQHVVVSSTKGLRGTRASCVISPNPARGHPLAWSFSPDGCACFELSFGDSTIIRA